MNSKQNSAAEEIEQLLLSAVCLIEDAHPGLLTMRRPQAERLADLRLLAGRLEDIVRTAEALS